MAEQSAQERTEEATPKRRQEARKKGTVARSQDLTSAIVIGGMLFVMPYALMILGNGFLQGVKFGLGSISSDASPATLTRTLYGVIQPILPGVAMIFAAAMAFGLASNFAQVGFVLSGQALSPNFNKLNPLNGIKRIFSLSATFDGVKAVVKSALFGFLAYSTIRSNWDSIFMLSALPPGLALSVIGGIIRSIAMRVAIAWLTLAVLDYMFQRKQINKQLMMSKAELKQEMREMEQSPELRSAIAQKRRKLRRRMMQAIRNADAVITNPTHFAIAIQYEAGKNHAPQVVAKGADLLAARIREEAKKHGVPLVPNPPLARALYKVCDVGDFVPREYFQAVAEVLAYVYNVLKKVRKT